MSRSAFRVRCKLTQRRSPRDPIRSGRFLRCQDAATGTLLRLLSNCKNNNIQYAATRISTVDSCFLMPGTKQQIHRYRFFKSLRRIQRGIIRHGRRKGGGPWPLCTLKFYHGWGLPGENLFDARLTLKDWLRWSGKKKNDFFSHNVYNTWTELRLYGQSFLRFGKNPEAAKPSTAWVL